MSFPTTDFTFSFQGTPSTDFELDASWQEEFTKYVLVEGPSTHFDVDQLLEGMGEEDSTPSAPSSSSSPSYLEGSFSGPSSVATPATSTISSAGAQQGTDGSSSITIGWCPSNVPHPLAYQPPPISHHRLWSTPTNSQAFDSAAIIGDHGRFSFPENAVQLPDMPPPHTEQDSYTYFSSEAGPSTVTQNPNKRARLSSVASSGYSYSGWDIPAVASPHMLHESPPHYPNNRSTLHSYTCATPSIATLQRPVVTPEVGTPHPILLGWSGPDVDVDLPPSASHIAVATSIPSSTSFVRRGTKRKASPSSSAFSSPYTSSAAGTAETDADTRTGVCRWKYLDEAGKQRLCNTPVDNGSLANHIKTVHRPWYIPEGGSTSDPCPNEQITRCEWVGCENQAVKWGQVCRHIRTTHLKWTAVQCETCGRVLSRRDSIKRHKCSAS
ncbi:hypothetical protein V5O48_006202 [Marasmius crinis-equi]|uniref:C2H2-type domain-containing protein n=1 Tax=Marasmius crinis-equi TaxID=585013 RepID=A0ABR3FK78_9AGAR